MELLKAIYQRRAVREFSDATVTPALVHDLLHAAAQAPSALNLQPWSFAVFHGRARLADYSRRAKRHLLATSAPTFGLDPRIDHYANPDANLFHGADTLVVICAKPGPFASVEDCFLAAQNLMHRRSEGMTRLLSPGAAAHAAARAKCASGLTRLEEPEVTTGLIAEESAPSCGSSEPTGHTRPP